MQHVLVGSPPLVLSSDADSRKAIQIIELDIILLPGDFVVRIALDRPFGWIMIKGEQAKTWHAGAEDMGCCFGGVVRLWMLALQEPGTCPIAVVARNPMERVGVALHTFL